MLELPDYRKISFPEMPPIPLEEVVTDASPEVSLMLIVMTVSPVRFLLLMRSFILSFHPCFAGGRLAEEIFGV